MPGETLRGPRERVHATGLPARPERVGLAPAPRRLVRPRRVAGIALGLAVLVAILLSPLPPAVVDPRGGEVALTAQGRDSLAVFALCAVWWGFEVVPIGVTALVAGAAQVLLHVRPARAALSDFLDPGVWLVMGTMLLGVALTRTGLVQRAAYRLLSAFGDRTRLVVLGAFVTTAVPALVVPHTAVAAVVLPLLLAIYPLYDEGRQPTRFGKSLFIGLALSANAASTATMLGSARAPVAASLYEQMTGRPVSFVELGRYLAPVAVALLGVSWLLVIVLFPPERAAVVGLRERLRAVSGRLAPVSWREILTMIVAGLAVAALCLAGSWAADRGAVLALCAVVLFFAGVLGIRDLESLPWNILLLLGGATSLGACLWQTGAARWLALHLVSFLGDAGGLWIVLALGAVVLLATNVLVNVATLALILPVGVAAAPYLGVAPEAVFYTTLCAAGLPLLSVAGAAPNAMAFESRQFGRATFLRAGLPASALALAVLALFLLLVWPRMGMPVLALG